jgi:hypothetical protein
MQHPTFERTLQPFRIDDETAIVRTHQTLYPNVTGSAIHFDFRHFGENRLTAKRVRETTAGQDVAVGEGPR